MLHPHTCRSMFWHLKSVNSLKNCSPKEECHILVGLIKELISTRIEQKVTFLLLITGKTETEKMLKNFQKLGSATIGQFFNKKKPLFCYETAGKKILLHIFKS